MENLDAYEFFKNWQNYFMKLIAKVGTMFFGMTSNQSMYTQWEFYSVTQEQVHLVAKHDKMEVKMRFL